MCADTWLFLILLIAIAMLVMPRSSSVVAAERFDGLSCMADCETLPEETRSMCQQRCTIPQQRSRKQQWTDDNDEDNDDNGLREHQTYKRGWSYQDNDD